MNLIQPRYTGQDAMRIASIDQATLANWLRRGLLDRLGYSEKFKGRHRKYSALDIITITAEAQLAFMGLTQKARSEKRIAEQVTGKCQALISGVLPPIPEFSTFTCKTPEHNLGVELRIDCQQIAEYVVKELERL